MRASKRYRQLKLNVDCFRDHYDKVFLLFKIGRRPVCGILNGNSVDWMFQSDSPEFLKLVPSGVLCKYALWIDAVPCDLGKVYDGVLEAAMKAGYDLREKGEGEFGSSQVHKFTSWG